MKTKIIIVCMLLLSCLPGYAGKSTRNFAIGAALGVLGGAMIANASNQPCRNAYCHTEHVYDYRPSYNNYYTERVEVCRPVVETRRVYTQPARRVVSYYNTRPSRSEVYYTSSCAPVYQCNEYCSVNY